MRGSVLLVLPTKDDRWLPRNGPARCGASILSRLSVDAARGPSPEQFPASWPHRRCQAVPSSRSSGQWLIGQVFIWLLPSTSILVSAAQLAKFI